MPPHGPSPYEVDPYGGIPYGPYGPYGGGQYGGPYGGDPYAEAWYRQAASGHAGHDQSGYGQAPYGGGPYGFNPYGQQAYFGGPPQPPYGTYQSQPFGWPYVPSAPRRTPEERRKRTRRAFTFAAVLVLAVGTGIGIGAAIAPTNPTTVARALVSSSVAAVQHAGTFRYSELSTTLGVPDNIIGVAAPHGGRQLITERCTSGTNVFDLRLVNGIVYFKGNDPAVVDQLGVSAATAGAEVGKWVKVTKGESPYRSFSLGITTKSNISQLTSTFLAEKSRANSTTTDIFGGLNDHGKPIGTATLVITSASKLPRSFNASKVATAGRISLAWTFGHFGQAVHVSAPSKAVAYSSLHTKAPPKTACG